jgi:hypothetical protein
VQTPASHRAIRKMKNKRRMLSQSETRAGDSQEGKQTDPVFDIAKGGDCRSGY